MKVFYNDISSALNQSGFLSDFFKLIGDEDRETLYHLIYSYCVLKFYP